MLRDNTFLPCYKLNCDVIKTKHFGDKSSCHNSLNGVKWRSIRKRDNLQQKKYLNTSTKNEQRTGKRKCIKNKVNNLYTHGGNKKKAHT